MKQSHDEFGNEANEFGNELVKSGSESTIGRMQTGYFMVEQNAVKSGNVDERDDVMRLGLTPAVVLWRPLERILRCARRLNESLSKFAFEVS